MWTFHCYIGVFSKKYAFEACSMDDTNEISIIRQHFFYIHVHEMAKPTANVAELHCK